MRSSAWLVALASLALVTACSEDPDLPAAEPVESAEVPSPEPTEAEAMESEEEPMESEDMESEEPAETEDEAMAGEMDMTVLTGTVGTADDPDAFVITLTDDTGEPVTTLPAGDYQIEINDLSEIHNFHLTGGPVEESTTVPEVTDTVWEVNLEPGDYTFVCDPHPNMVGEFAVT